MTKFILVFLSMIMLSAMNASAFTQERLEVLGNMAGDLDPVLAEGCLIVGQVVGDDRAPLMALYTSDRGCFVDWSEFSEGTQIMVDGQHLTDLKDDDAKLETLKSVKKHDMKIKGAATYYEADDARAVTRY